MPEGVAVGSDQLEAIRPQVLLYCYQMLGSPFDAQDAAQETLLRAWRHGDSYDASRASLRTWVHRIATNVCLTMLTARQRRPLPADLNPPGLDPAAPLVPDFETPWLQPAPSSWFATGQDDPAAQAVARGDLRIAITALLQQLPARQRAALILRDVLGFTAQETAGQLDLTVAACNSALQRARASLPLKRQRPGTSSTEERQAVQRYAAAFLAADVEALVRLVSHDVRFEMPPVPAWSVGVEPYAAFMRHLFAWRGPDWQASPLLVNGQHGLAVSRLVSGVPEPHTIQVFDLDPAGRISHVLVYHDPAIFRLLTS
ncbi:RNA polymerase subunit sigma-70 [Oryzihumus sp.]|uniref:RNA polymerase subunit sigma-70 n=1 Tax=Oryzihumus sp. TaxID=1968903 RepID=UPI002EDB0BCB